MSTAACYLFKALFATAARVFMPKAERIDGKYHLPASTLILWKRAPRVKSQLYQTGIGDGRPRSVIDRLGSAVALRFSPIVCGR